MDQQPKIPTLKDAQKPQVKIKGMGAGLTLFDRLKQFKKKDLAFILAGLGTLFMAPLAEHFMMAPENGDASLQQGWGGGSGRGGTLFGSGSSPYENGNNGIAQGGAIGGAGDIITPLNVRDPSALVMGPGAAQQPPAGSAAPATAPTAPSRSEADYKDALAGAASRAASAAVKKSLLPVPKVALGGSGLRGLGAASGGTSAGSSLLPINSGNLGQAGTGGGGLNLVRSTPGFRNAAGARSPTGSGNLDGTKKAGANAGDAFSRTGSALSGLNAAASEQIPTGGTGFAGGGQGGMGANDKGPGGSGPGGSKSVGESLAFIKAKEIMMNKLKLDFEKQKLKDPELLMYGIRNDALKAMASELTKSLTKTTLGFLAGAGDGTTHGFFCADGEFYPDSGTSYCLADGKFLGQPNGASGACLAVRPPITCKPGSRDGKGDAKTGEPKVEVGSTNGSDRLANGKDIAENSPIVGELLDTACAKLGALGTTASGTTGIVGKGADGEIEYYSEMNASAIRLVEARSLLTGAGTGTACKVPPATSTAKPAVVLQADAIATLNAQLPLMTGLVPNTEPAADKQLEAIRQEVANAATFVGAARKNVDGAAAALEAATGFVTFPGNADALDGINTTTALVKVKGALARDHKSIDAELKKLEATLKKVQATVGVNAEASTLGGVLAENKEFVALKSAFDEKKKTFAEVAKDEANKKAWAGAASVTDPENVTTDGSAEPDAVTTDVEGAKKSIGDLCAKIGGCGKAAPDAVAPTDAPLYSEVEPLIKPSTDGVTKMRETQSKALSTINKELKAMGPSA